MKTFKTILILILSISSIISFGQNFEGTLSYTTNIEIFESMKKMGLTKENLMKRMEKENLFSSKINYSYKNENYLIEMLDNGATSKYIGKNNKIYTREKKEDLIVVIDASIDLENKMFGTIPKIENKQK